MIPQRHTIRGCHKIPDKYALTTDTDDAKTQVHFETQACKIILRTALLLTKKTPLQSRGSETRVFQTFSDRTGAVMRVRSRRACGMWRDQWQSLERRAVTFRLENRVCRRVGALSWCSRECMCKDPVSIIDECQHRTHAEQEQMVLSNRVFGSDTNESNANDRNNDRPATSVEFADCCQTY